MERVSEAQESKTEVSPLSAWIKKWALLISASGAVFIFLGASFTKLYYDGRLDSFGLTREAFPLSANDVPDWTYISFVDYFGPNFVTFMAHWKQNMLMTGALVALLFTITLSAYECWCLRQCEPPNSRKFDPGVSAGVFRADCG